MTIDYKKLKYFQKAHQFVIEIYKITKESFPKEELYGLTSQIRRASVSITSNIAEGSCKGEVEFKRYLQIALGSAKEVEVQLLLSKDLDYITRKTYDSLQGDLDLIIGSLISYMKRIV